MANKFVWASATIVILIILAVVATYYYTIISHNIGLSPSTPPTPTPATPSSTPPATTDLNWGGYAASSNFNNPQPVVSGVSGSWTVPQIKVSQNDTFSAIWVGIGGTFGNTLIQTGTEQDCVNGVVSYFAWYELLPEVAITITTMDVSPGDKISGSITLSDQTLSKWTISINDLSNGQSFNQDFFYDSSRLSAEWVVERPLVNNILSQLSDFSIITFSDCSVTLDSKPENLNTVHSLKIVLSNKQKTQLVDVSNVSSDGSGFTIKYMLPQ